MFYRTLHWYIIREMLRIFLMTAGGLTTLMAFGGMFKPVMKYGLDVTQLMMIMVNLMPAMLAYSIPVAALFAAVLVYWRMSTDNELTACRAGGISFVAIVAPAFAVGLVVASVDIVFVHFVVPRYLQATERAVMRDLGGLLVSAIGRQEPFRYGKMTVYADRASLLPGEKEGESVVVLEGMAATPMEKGKASSIVVAEEARLTIRDVPNSDETEVEISVTGAAAFDPATFRKVTGSVQSIAPGGQNLRVPSQLKTKPKYLNLKQLDDLYDKPYLFPPVKEIVKRVEHGLKYEEVSGTIFAEWAKRGSSKPIEFDVQGMGSSAAKEELKVYAPVALLDTNKTLMLGGNASTRVRVEQYKAGKLTSTYVADRAKLVLAMDDFLAGGMTGALELAGNVTRQDHVRNIEANKVGDLALSGIVIDPRMFTKAPMEPLKQMQLAQVSTSPGMRELYEEGTKRMLKLFQTIRSEKHSRMSFAVSCLTLVLLGAALGILMKGKNPLAVFVVGFVPAVFLVLLITAGRQLTEGAAKNEAVGLTVIWAGNGLLLMMLLFVYGKLLRQ